MKTKTTQSQQIAYAAMLVQVLAIALAILFQSLFYAGIGFGFIMGMVVGALFIQTKFKEAKALLESTNQNKAEGGDTNK